MLNISETIEDRDVITVEYYAISWMMQLWNPFPGVWDFWTFSFLVSWK